MQPLLRHAEREFRHFLAGCDRVPPMLRRTSIEENPTRYGTFRIETEFSDGRYIVFNVQDDPHRPIRRNSSRLERDLVSVYSRLWEDRLLAIQTRENEAILERAMRNALFFGSQEAPSSAQTATQVAAREGTLTVEDLRRTMDAMQMHRDHMQQYHRYYEPRPAPPDMNVMQELLRQQTIVDEVTGLNNPLFAGYLGTYGGLIFHDDVGDHEAQKRGLDLLKSWLTPEQFAQYKKDKSFEVKGSDTGKRYRINHGRQMNIEELDDGGKVVCGWCFLPEGGLVAGDVMLAQKIALETKESAALKVANKFEGRVGTMTPWVTMSPT